MEILIPTPIRRKPVTIISGRLVAVLGKGPPIGTVVGFFTFTGMVTRMVLVAFTA